MESSLGLFLLATRPWELEESHVVFNTRNLTKSLAVHQNGQSLSNTNPGEAQPISMSCLFSSNCVSASFVRDLCRKLVPGSLAMRPDSSIDSLLMTKCIVHGTAGYAPLDYVKTLPEYTCVLHKHPRFKMVHSLDECVLEFPCIQVMELPFGKAVFV